MCKQIKLWIPLEICSHVKCSSNSRRWGRISSWLRTKETTPPPASSSSSSSRLLKQRMHLLWRSLSFHRHKLLALFYFMSLKYIFFSVNKCFQEWFCCSFQMFLFFYTLSFNLIIFCNNCWRIVSLQRRRNHRSAQEWKAMCTSQKSELILKRKDMDKHLYVCMHICMYIYFYTLTLERQRCITLRSDLCNSPVQSIFISKGGYYSSDS